MDNTHRTRPGVCLLLTSVAFFMVALDALAAPGATADARPLVGADS